MHDFQHSDELCYAAISSVHIGMEQEMDRNNSLENMQYSIDSG